MDDKKITAYELIKKFQNLQEERAQTYHLFEEGHKMYLCSGPSYDFPRFRHLVQDITQEFKRISQGILEIQRRLREELDQKQIAEFIVGVQENEEKKLELTAHLQLARQALKENPDASDTEKEYAELKVQLNQVVETINEHLEEIRYGAADLF